MIVCAAGIRQLRRESVLAVGRSQTLFPESIRWAARQLPPRSLVLAMEFTGAMKSYGGPPFIRWDCIEPNAVGRLRRRTESAGYSWYALLLPHEVPDVARRVPGPWKYRGSHREATLWELELPPPSRGESGAQPPLRPVPTKIEKSLSIAPRSERRSSVSHKASRSRTWYGFSSRKFTTTP